MWEVREVKYNECHLNKVGSGKGLVGKTAPDLVLFQENGLEFLYYCRK